MDHIWSIRSSCSLLGVAGVYKCLSVNNTENAAEVKLHESLLSMFFVCKSNATLSVYCLYVARFRPRWGKTAVEDMKCI